MDTPTTELVTNGVVCADVPKGVVTPKKKLTRAHPKRPSLTLNRMRSEFIASIELDRRIGYVVMVLQMMAALMSVFFVFGCAVMQLYFAASVLDVSADVVQRWLRGILGAGGFGTFFWVFKLLKYWDAKGKEMNEQLRTASSYRALANGAESVEKLNEVARQYKSSKEKAEKVTGRDHRGKER